MFYEAGWLLSQLSAFPEVYTQKPQNYIKKVKKREFFCQKKHIWQLWSFIYGWSTEITVHMKGVTFYRSLCMRQNSLKTGQMRHSKAFQKNTTTISIFVYFSVKLFMSQINLLRQHKNKNGNKW